MMQQDSAISQRSSVGFYQLFALIFISRMTSTLTISLHDRLTLFSPYVLIFLPLVNSVLLVFALPIYLLYKRYHLNIIDCVSLKINATLGKYLGILYAGYFAVLMIRALTRFGYFMTTTLSSPLSALGFVSMILVAALYGVHLGLEPLARTGIVIALLISLMFAMIVVSVFPSISLDRLEPLTIDGPRVFWEFLDYASRSAEIVALGILASRGQGSFKKGICLTVLAITIVGEIFVFLPQATLGLYTKMLMYPFFEITTLFEQGIFQRTDVFFASIWVFGIFYQVTLFLYLTEFSLRGFSKGRFKMGIAAVFALGTGYASVYLADHLTPEFQETWQLIFDIYGALLLSIPFIVLFVLRWRERKTKTARHKIKLRSKLVAVLLLCTCTLTGLTGCVSQPHTRSLLFIEALGIDREDDQYRITVQVFDPTHMGGTFQEQGGPITRVDSALGASVSDAMHNLVLTNGKHILYTKNRFIILGEEVAREGFLTVIDFLLRNREARSSLHIATARGKASDVIQATMNQDVIPMLEMLRVLTNGKDYGVSVEMRLIDIMNAVLEGSASPYMPAVRAMKKDAKTGQKTPIDGGASEGQGDSSGGGSEGDSSTLMQLDGIALFSKDRLVSFLPQEETLGFVWLTGNGNGGVTTFSFPSEEPGSAKRQATVQTYDLSTKIEVDLSSGMPRFMLSLEGAATLDSVSPNLLRDYETSVYEEIERSHNEKIEELCQQTINEVIRAQKLDVLCLGRMLRLREPEYWLQNHERWEQILPFCEIKVESAIQLHRVGMTAGNKESGT